MFSHFMHQNQMSGDLENHIIKESSHTNNFKQLAVHFRLKIGRKSWFKREYVHLGHHFIFSPFSSSSPSLVPWDIYNHDKTENPKYCQDQVKTKVQTRLPVD